MSIWPYLLLFATLVPAGVVFLERFYPRLRLNPALFLSPLMLLVLTGVSFIIGQPIALVFIKSSYFSLGFKLDVLSGLIASTVLTIGVVVSRYSVRYLQDDPQRDQFMRSLSWTLTSVLFMLLSSNLLELFLAWVGTSYFLHKLLTHFSQRTEAVKAAQQKFWVSRMGDLFIVISGVLLLWVFGSLEFETLFEKIEDPQLYKKNYWLIQVTSVFLVLGAMAKSAQFPFHFWLPNTMETPTPVSALMHAGIINAGGYLVVRMSPFLAHTPAALSLLALVGGFTALYGFVVMLTQTNVKRSLAYSTISQMGFMMLQCGLGAFSMAVLHIIGHAFYKAYAFLSSGTATDFGRLNRYYPRPVLKTNLGLLIGAAFISMGLTLGAASLFGFDMKENPGIAALLVILSLAIAQIFLSSPYKSKSFVAAVSLVAIYLSFSRFMKALLFEITPSQIQGDGLVRFIVLALCVSFFIILFFLQNNLEKVSRTTFGKKLYVKALRGSIL